MRTTMKMLTVLRAAAGGGGVSASTIPGTFLWLEADKRTFQASDGTTPAAENGDPVGYWGDQSANANNPVQATTANKPTLTLNAVNGLPAIAYDGSDDVLMATDDDSLSPTNISLYVVAKYSAMTPNGQLLISKASQEYWINTFNSRFNCRINTTDNAPATGFATTNWAIFRVRYNGTRIGFKVTGSNENSVAKTGDMSNTTTVLNLGNAPFTGLIQAVYGFNHELSAAEQAVIETYVTGRTGLSV